jgi:hypothetical protein
MRDREAEQLLILCGVLQEMDRQRQSHRCERPHAEDATALRCTVGPRVHTRVLDTLWRRCERTRLHHGHSAALCEFYSTSDCTDQACQASAAVQYSAELCLQAVKCSLHILVLQSYAP